MLFEILGPVRVRRDAATPDRPALLERDLGGPRQRTVLLSLIMYAGDVVRTDHLIDLVWGSAPPAKPLVTLRSYVSVLRKALDSLVPNPPTTVHASSVLQTRTHGYLLDVDPDRIDAVRFATLVDQARQALDAGDPVRALSISDTALALWRTEHLDPILATAFPGDVTRLVGLRAVARTTRLEAMIALGRHAEAVPLLEAAVSAEPFDEHLRGLLMTALYRCGRPADALAVFRQVRSTLIEQLGLEPSADLQTLELRILEDDPSLRWPSGVPPFPTSLRSVGSLSGAEDVLRRTNAPMTAPIFGRVQERTSMEAALDHTLVDRRGWLVTLQGEPGIGKTTLADGLAEVARARGALVAWGRSHQTGAASPLRPWAALLGDVLDQCGDDVGHVIGRDGPVLARFVPAISDHLPRIGPEDADRLTTFDTVARTLRRAARRTPLVCILEDLHWASPVTVDLIHFVHTELADETVLLVCTWRDTELDAVELGALFGVLRRAAGMHHLDLEGIDVEAILALQDELFGGPLTSDEADRVLALTGGNPLFVVEMLRARERTGVLQSTETIRDVLLSRIASLPAGTVETLTLASLCPAGFSEQLLARASGTAEEMVATQLDAAADIGLVEDDPDHPGQVRFTHALVAEALTHSLTGPRRAALHRRIADALEAGPSSPQLLAYHFLRSPRDGGGSNAARHAHRAAVEAMDHHDHDEAGRLLEAGLVALEHTDHALRSDLLVALAQVRKHQESIDGAHRSCIEAFSLARDIDDVDRMGTAALVFAGWLSPGRGSVRDQWLGYWAPPAPSIEMLEQTLARLSDDHPLWIPLRSALIGQCFGDFEDDERCRVVAAETEERARRLGDPRVLAAVLQNLHFKFQRTDELDQRIGRLDELLALSRRHDLIGFEVDTRRSRYVVALDRADPVSAHAEIEACRRAAGRSGDLVSSMTAEVGRLALLLLEGRLAECERGLLAAFERYARLGAAALDQFGLQLATLRREQGRLDEVESLLRWKLDGYPGTAYTAPLAAVLAQQGRDDEAIALVASLPPSELAGYGEPVLQFITPAFFAEALGLTALRSGRLDDEERVRTLYQRLLPAEGRTVAMFDGIATYGCGSYYLALLAMVDGRLDEARRHLTRAQDHHRRIGARPYLLRGLVAEVRLAELRGENSTEIRGHAGSLATELGMTWILDTWIPPARPN